MNKLLVKAGLVLLSGLALQMPVQAQSTTKISPVLKKMLAALPIPGLKDKVSFAMAALRKTNCGVRITDCYSLDAGPMVQLYFFTHKSVEQTLLLVINKDLSMAPLFGPDVQKVLGSSGLKNPIFSISTTDYDLNIKDMPEDLKAVVKDSYFGVGKLSFPAGVQLATRVSTGGAFNTGMEALGVKASQYTIRAGVVMPIPADLSSATGSAADIALAVKHGDTMKKSVASALSPEAYLEFQFAPGSGLSMMTPPMSLEDVTLFINNSLTFGYKGNARFNGTNKRILLDFKTPLTPEGVMDFADFKFRMAMPAGGFSLEDAGNVILAMYLPTPPGKLAKDGGFIGDIKSIKQPLQNALKPLALFKMENPLPPADYKFGDANRPFPTNNDPFNIVIYGPLEQGGPMLRTASIVSFMGLPVGSMSLEVGPKGLHAMAEEKVVIPLGPLGQIGGRMKSNIDLDGKVQKIKLLGDFAGRNLSLTLDGSTLRIDSPATCLTPVEFKASVAVTADQNINTILQSQGGVNVDPSKLTNCVGADLEKAYKWIASTGKNISGYSASEANTALKKITDGVANQAKNAARTLANNSTSQATNAFKSVGNAFKGFGSKKSKSGTDNRLDPYVFDWDYYYDTQGAAWGQADLVEHWRTVGFGESRRASYEFDLNFYRQHNGLGGSNQDLINHWLKDGINRCLQSSPDFSVNDLKNRHGYKDCRTALVAWFDSGGVLSGFSAKP